MSENTGNNDEENHLGIVNSPELLFVLFFFHGFKR